MVRRAHHTLIKAHVGIIHQSILLSYLSTITTRGAGRKHLTSYLPRLLLFFFQSYISSVCYIGTICIDLSRLIASGENWIMFHICQLKRLKEIAAGGHQHQQHPTSWVCWFIISLLLNSWRRSEPQASGFWPLFITDMYSHIVALEKTVRRDGRTAQVFFFFFLPTR